MAHTSGQGEAPPALAAPGTRRSAPSRARQVSCFAVFFRPLAFFSRPLFLHKALLRRGPRLCLLGHGLLGAVWGSRLRSEPSPIRGTQSQRTQSQRTARHPTPRAPVRLAPFTPVCATAGRPHAVCGSFPGGGGGGVPQTQREKRRSRATGRDPGVRGNPLSIATSAGRQAIADDRENRTAAHTPRGGVFSVPEGSRVLAFFCQEQHKKR